MPSQPDAITDRHQAKLKLSLAGRNRTEWPWPVMVAHPAVPSQGEDESG